MSVADKRIEMDSNEWKTLHGLFKDVHDKMDALPCKEHGEKLARMAGMKNGENSVKQETSQSQTLSMRRVGVMFTILFGLFKTIEIIISRF